VGKKEYGRKCIGHLLLTEMGNWVTGKGGAAGHHRRKKKMLTREKMDAGRRKKKKNKGKEKYWD